MRSSGELASGPSIQMDSQVSQRAPCSLQPTILESISHTTPRSIQSSWLKTQETLVTPLATPPAKASRGEYLHLKLLLLRKSGKPDTIGSLPS